MQEYIVRVYVPSVVKGGSYVNLYNYYSNIKVD